MCKFFCKYLIFKMIFHVLYKEKGMHYENDQFALFTHSKQSERKQMGGRECFYDLKTEVYDCPEHQNFAMWESKSTIHTHFIYLEVKLRHDIAQGTACLKQY